MEKTTIKLNWETPAITNLDIDQTETGLWTAPTEATTLSPGS